MSDRGWNPQHSCTRMAIAGQHICWVGWELNTAPCNAACVLFSAKGLITPWPTANFLTAIMMEYKVRWSTDTYSIFTFSIATHLNSAYFTKLCGVTNLQMICYTLLLRSRHTNSCRWQRQNRNYESHFNISKICLSVPTIQAGISHLNMAVLSSGKSFLQGNPFCTSSFRFRWKKQKRTFIYFKMRITCTNKVRFGGLTMTTKFTVFWDMSLCSLGDSTKVLDSCCLHTDWTTQAQMAGKHNCEDRGWGYEEDNWGRRLLQNGVMHITSLKMIIWVMHILIWYISKIFIWDSNCSLMTCMPSWTEGKEKAGNWEKNLVTTYKVL